MARMYEGRRRFLAGAAATGMIAWLDPRWLYAQGQGGVVDAYRKSAATATIESRRLRRGVDLLSGSGGNMTLLTGPDGKLLVDAGVDTSRRQLLEALGRSGPQPLKHVINTHWHFDHTGCNQWLHEAGATIVAHENTRRHLSKATRVEGWSHTFPPAPAAAVPGVSVTARHVLQLNGETIVLEPYGPCHTDSDLSVRFTEADILQTGDTWWNGHYPFIDYSTGGSITETIRAAEANIAAAGPQTLVVPGHGPVGGRRELVEFRDVLVSARDSIAALKKKGMSLPEVVAARPTKAHDARWGGSTIDASTFIALVYGGV